MRPVLVLALFSVCSLSAAAPLTISVSPSADTFAREAAPTANYGLAGGLAVAGEEASSYFDPSQKLGRMDSFLRFPMSALAASMNSQFGSGRWHVKQATLNLVEQLAPNNPMFGCTPGTFRVYWLANDSWAEGTGTPNAPASDGLHFQDVPSLIEPVADVPLGVFSNVGVGTGSAPVVCNLLLPAEFVEDILSGDDVTLHLVADSANVAFTFNSRDITGGRPLPSLSVTAEALSWPIPGDANLDCTVNLLDLIFVRNLLNHPVSSGSNWKADVNSDGAINLLDLLYVRNRLNTSCPR